MRVAKFDLIVYRVPGQKRTAFTTQREPKHHFYLKLVYNLSISLLRKVALLLDPWKTLLWQQCCG